MPMDRKLCGNKEGKGSDIRVPPQHTVEPLAPSAKELALYCSEAQAPLQPATIQTANATVTPSGRSSQNLYIKAATVPGGMKWHKGETSGIPFDSGHELTHRNEKTSREAGAEKSQAREPCGGPANDQGQGEAQPTVSPAMGSSMQET
jgi:hypothetical protein